MLGRKFLKMNELLQTKVAADKEVLSVLPRNNVKNTKIYIKKLEEFIKLYTALREEVYQEIVSRNKRLSDVSVDKEIDTLKKEIEQIEGKMYLYNDLKTPSAKASLDVLLYNLSFFNKLNLADVNLCILKILDCFKKVGITVKLEDFRYSIFAYEYMSVYLEEVNDCGSNSDKLADCFEKVYWKCPDIIIHLKLCFVSLYYKNIKCFEKYYTNLRNQSKLDIDQYYDLVKRYDDKVRSDIALLLSRFVNKELNIKDYQDNKIEKILDELVLVKDDDVYSDILKLSYTLKEYKNYLDFKYLVSSIKTLYEQRASFKDCTKSVKKDIAKKEKLLSKYNKKLFKLWNNNKKENKINQVSVAVNSLMREINDLYYLLDENIFKEKIYNDLNDSSTIFDVLLLVYSDYNYLVKVIKSNNDSVSDMEIESIKNSLFKFLVSPYSNIINNTTLLFDGDLISIIRDKYNLINIKVTDSNLEDGSIMGFINTIDNVLVYNCINNSLLSLSDIVFILESMDILEKGVKDTVK